jgi:hypothetical protein
MFRSFIANDKRLPAGGGSVAQPEPPVSVQRAVRLMLGGAAASMVYFIFGLIITISQRNALIKAIIDSNSKQPKSKQLTLSQIHSYVNGIVVTTIIIGLFSVALWLWMARMNNRGRSWARITATAFFALWSFWTYQEIGSARSAATLTLALFIILVIWLIGLASVFFMWRPDSTAYYKSVSSPPDT